MQLQMQQNFYRRIVNQCLDEATFNSVCVENGVTLPFPKSMKRRRGRQGTKQTIGVIITSSVKKL